ncbi:NYN domain-containing protein [Patescibacteria group bacterium]|nr:NYN domain-containing protein [Patescibacteria group bacterium]
MFKAKTEKINYLAKNFPNSIVAMENVLSGKVNMYIDYANVRSWSNKLAWNIDLKRLKQFLDSFDNINSIKFYDGTLESDPFSIKESKERLRLFGSGFITKPVKIMNKSIDFTSIKPSSIDLLQQFIRKCLLKEYEVKTIEYLNNRFREMNKKDLYYIEDLKCNFDVEIGRDMLLDFERDNINTFILWSGDSDFYDPIKQLLDDDKRVILFATARCVSSELNKLKDHGLKIFDIQKIRNFICWRKQIQRKKDPAVQSP